MRRSCSIAAAVLLLSSTLGVAAPAQKKTAKKRRDRYSPAAYLDAKAPLAAAAAQPPEAAPQLGFTIVCASEPPAAAPVCPPNDPGCSAALERTPAGKGAKRDAATAPSGADIAQQVLTRVRDNCRPTTTGPFDARGFHPDVEVSLSDPAASGAKDGKRHVTATFGVSGYF